MFDHFASQTAPDQNLFTLSDGDTWVFQTDGRRHCRINHFAATDTPATLIKDQIFSNHFPVSYKKAQRRRVLILCGVVLLSIGHFLKVSLCEPAFIGVFIVLYGKLSATDFTFAFWYR